ncbi:minichromosome maintenance protein 5 [Entomophthora muscae]|uniref:Minichromosome maintenance protein 5 n=1 Tax=Entomophthora muscae TaxID=34485 RepID=A0ACC2TE80_9FUNG|nr:minichromosome maintenance protein 5 [Entomophthora muscae]
MATNGWDQNQVFATSNVMSGTAQENGEDGSNINHKAIEDSFFSFIQSFMLGNSYFYRDQLVANIKEKLYKLEVQIDHLISFDFNLAQNLQDYPTEYLEAFEAAVVRSAVKLDRSLAADGVEDDAFPLGNRMPSFQVELKSTTTMQEIRHLNAGAISKLVKITGIIVAASTLSSKATQLHLRCKSCGFTKQLPVGQGLTGVQLPRSCDNPNKEANAERCPIDPFAVDHDRSRFVDQQTLKLQELHDKVPEGDVPKHLLLSADRCLVNQVVPGTRATVIGIYSTFQSGSSRGGAGLATRTPYIRIVGLVSDMEGLNRGVTNFDDNEVAEMEALARRPDLYQLICKSIAPAIYGNTEMKKAIACLLFGGSTKRLPDGIRLRGDINVLMMGDPSTAKSQLLKFTEHVAPISVYTSGKGSSAAGLTACVVRDPGTREFYLEGGAMVLADGGVVCIDEFDKMRDEDRVAIHEAMEQQTISIAKAGITTMLNSRTSVLAAANPVHGRYDDMRSPGDNIDFQTTILSRFDLIFIMRDVHDHLRDTTIARHVIGIHLNRANETEPIDDELDLKSLKRYIAYAKSRCAPRLSPEAAEALAGHFVGLRREVHQKELEASVRSAIPITIRQLEAIVRISESLAKMTLSPVATVSHVDEAIRLFKSSTMEAINRDEIGNNAGHGGRADLLEQMARVEREIRSRLPIGSQVTLRTLRDTLVGEGLHINAIERAISVMARQEVIQFRDSRRSIYRSGL